MSPKKGSSAPPTTKTDHEKDVGSDSSLREGTNSDKDCGCCSMHVISDEKAKTKKIIFWVAVVFNSILFWGLSAIELAALVGHLPESEDSIRALYPSVMTCLVTFTAVILFLGKFGLFLDMCVSWFMLCCMNKKDVAVTLHQSNFAQGGIQLFFYFSCSIVGETLLYFNYSPWFYFGFNIGSFMFIGMLADSHEFKYIWNTMRKGREVANKKYSSEKRWIYFLSGIEQFSFIIPPIALKAYHFLQVFASLFFAAKFTSESLGMSPDILYAILVGVFIFLGTFFIDVIIAKKWLYGMIMSWLFIGYTIGQEQIMLNNEYMYPVAWKSSASYAVFLLVISVIIMFVSLKNKKDCILVHDCKHCKRREESKFEGGDGEDESVACFTRHKRAVTQFLHKTTELSKKALGIKE